MIKILLVLVIILVISIALNIILIFLLKRKNIKKIKNFNEKIESRDKLLYNINREINNPKRKEEIENAIKKSKSISDYVDITNKLLNV